MTDKDSYISVIAPLRDDSDIVEPFVTELLDVLGTHYENFELVLVDDNSRDETVEVVSSLLARYERIRLIRLSRSFGQEVAISAGLDSVIGDFVVVMLPDSDPPALVPEMIEMARGGAETVYGIRRRRTTDPLFLRLGARFFYWYCDKLLGLDLPKNSTHFRVLSRRMVNALLQIKHRGRYLRTLGQHVGYLSQGFPYDLIQRRKRARTKSPIEAIELALEIMVSNSKRPLRIVTWIAVVLSLSNAAYISYLGARAVLGPGTSAPSSAGAIHLSLMFLFLFAVLAVMSEYLGHIVEESKGRPLYYVMDEKNSSVPLMEPAKKNVVTESAET